MEISIASAIGGGDRLPHSPQLRADEHWQSWSEGTMQGCHLQEPLQETPAHPCSNPQVYTAASHPKKAATM